MGLAGPAPSRAAGAPWRQEHADVAASAQACPEEVLLALVRWLHERTGEDALTPAGGVALKCGATTRLHREGSGRVRSALLEAARRTEGCLVVCVNSDASVRRRTGGGRPPAPVADRIRVLRVDVDEATAAARALLRRGRALLGRGTRVAPAGPSTG